MLGISINEGRFEFGKKIGAGSFGSVYYGVDTRADQEVAIKVESGNAKTPQLEYEARLYKILGNVRGLPTLHWYGHESGCSVMVLDLLGPSLQDLLGFCGHGFSLKTVLQLGHQTLDILEYVHSHGFLHRDLKPANFLVGGGDDVSQVQLIDFGLAKRYWSSKTGSHIPYRQRRANGIIGSAWYASVNAHLGMELSRRDDLESLGYTLVHFLRGALPWQRLDPVPETKEKKHEMIGRLKASIKWEALTEGMPACFSSFLMVAHCLAFEEKPDYQLLHRFLAITAEREGIVCDGEYDWTQRRQDGEVVEHAEEDDRLSCNLSQVSMDSTGDQMAKAKQYVMTGARRSGRLSSLDAVGGGGSSGSGVGPLMRVAANEGPHAEAHLMKAMQTAGIAESETFKMKKLGGPSGP